MTGGVETDAVNVNAATGTAIRAGTTFESDSIEVAMTGTDDRGCKVRPIWPGVTLPLTRATTAREGDAFDTVLRFFNDVDACIECVGWM